MKCRRGNVQIIHAPTKQEASGEEDKCLIRQRLKEKKCIRVIFCAVIGFFPSFSLTPSLTGYISSVILLFPDIGTP